MRSRTIREGSVGLLILFGLALLAGIVFWLRGIEFGKKGYQIIIEFANANKMQVGAPVRYRGVDVGKITNIEPNANGVDVTVEIEEPSLRIPDEVQIFANQSGLIGETSIDIIPQESLSDQALAVNPTDSECKSSLIICENERVQGEVGASFEELLYNTSRIAEVYADPQFFQNINAAAQNASIAAAEVAKLSNELTQLSTSVRQEVQTFSGAAASVSQAANQTSNEVTRAVDRLTQTADVTASQVNQAVGELSRSANTTSNQLSQSIDRIARTAEVTANQFGQTANQIGRTAEQYSVAAAQLNELATNVNSLVLENRGELVGTLNSISDTSNELSQLVSSLTPTVNKFSSTLDAADTVQVVRNLETLTANAAEASANLREISASFNEPTYLLTLQRTLDSARVTFENVQKITSDLDELTGDPSFRNNLNKLVNGLSSLVSSTEELEQQVLTAQRLEPINTAVNAPNATPEEVKQNVQLLNDNPNKAADKSVELTAKERKKLSQSLKKISAKN
ncbi:MlaD family protein [Oscillatoria salina]|uniref:MlaD family protein n=1 Tax=Oscillatoria salina TaxID=331517 RepID=UPI0013B5DE6A|nr:MlaD family protein [Oscillatoria salina]MBZ8179246.1 MCE family protein [Oscillatoria salina IIICB1]NET89550.1 MCE family protein [Kamptonema sp. SIO1D9]